MKGSYANIAVFSMIFGGVCSALIASSLYIWLIIIGMSVVGVVMLLQNNSLIKQLELSNEQLINEKESNFNDTSADELVREEIKDVLEKLKIGFLGYKVNASSKNPNIENVRILLNESMQKFNEDLDQALKVLTEYGNSNFAYKVDTNKLSGKTGSLLLGIRALGSSVSELIALIDKTSNALNENINVLASASNSLSIASNQQAASLEETAAALEEITGTIVNNSSNTKQMSKYANEVSDAVHTGQELANQTVISMENINKEVLAINDAITVIDQIAFQTNILSLNAAVEAATAGEAGKGFAVVAGEVRNLATRSAEAAKEIKALVESATNKANHGKTIANEMISGYTNLNNNIAQTIALINDVTNASREQQAGIEQINDAVTQLDQATQQNAASATHISEMAKEIATMAQNLMNTVQQANFDPNASLQVCDMSLVLHLNRLKLDHINFKNNNCAKLGSKSSWSVVSHHDCNLGKWIDESEKQNKIFTKTPNWAHLKDVHQKVHQGMQNIIIENSKSSNNASLAGQSHALDEAISDVFWTIQQVKRDNCQA